MNFWMSIALDDLKKVLQKVDVLLVNDSEARELSGEFSLVKAARKILQMGPKYLIIKKGEHGALLFQAIRYFLHRRCRWKMCLILPVPAIRLPAASLATLPAPSDISFENMKTAIIVGSAMASFCVEKFGIERLTELSKADIDRRISSSRSWCILILSWCSMGF